MSYDEGGLPELDSEVYEIDYRGPETHSSIPPPDHSHGRGKPVIRHESDVVPPESKATGRKNVSLHYAFFFFFWGTDIHLIFDDCLLVLLCFVVFFLFKLFYVGDSCFAGKESSWIEKF